MGHPSEASMKCGRNSTTEKSGYTDATVDMALAPDQCCGDCRCYPVRSSARYPTGANSTKPDRCAWRISSTSYRHRAESRSVSANTVQPGDDPQWSDVWSCWRRRIVTARFAHGECGGL